MVYIHFPSNLTEEELMLQAKYQKLKKKVSEHRKKPEFVVKLTVFYRKKPFKPTKHRNKRLTSQSFPNDHRTLVMPEK